MRTQLRSHSNVLFQSSLTLLISNVKSLWIQNPCYHENHVRAEMAVRSDVHPSSCDQQSTCCCQVAIKLPSSMCWLSSAQVNLSCLDTYSDDWHHHWCGAGWWWWGCAGETAADPIDNGFASIFTPIADGLETECFFLNIKSWPPHRHCDGTSVAAWWWSHKYTINAESVPSSNTLKGASASLFCLVPRWLFFLELFPCRFYCNRLWVKVPFHLPVSSNHVVIKLLWTGTFLKKVFEPELGQVPTKLVIVRTLL